MIARCVVDVLQGSVVGLVATFGWIAVYVVVVVQYFGLRRWDQAWRRRWEQKHGRSLETLRERSASWRWSWGMLWTLVALIVFEVATGPLSGRSTTCSKVHGFVILALLLPAAIFNITVARAQRQKLDELLGR